jgi:CBS domain-containing protein
MKIHEIMSRTLKTIPPEATIVEAAQLMRELDVGVLPVSDGTRAVGMLTDRDIVVRAVASYRDLAQTCVRDFITTHVCSIFADQDVADAGELMADEQVRRLLVVDRDHVAVGIVTLGDLVRGAAAAAAETAMEGVT